MSRALSFVLGVAVGVVLALGPTGLWPLLLLHVLGGGMW